MSHDLSCEDFAPFFQQVHGYSPFPWQLRLLRKLVAEGEWPQVLDLPAGSGKTAALDAAVFHLALEAERGEVRRAPVRIALAVDRRLVVDEAFERAKKIVEALSNPKDGVTAEVARRLQSIAGEGAGPLIASRLRGGIPWEDDWARTPCQPTILCSTVDQVGSRLLFRGYGVSNSMKPVHAGLIGSDCLILLDEAHVSEPFRQTLEWVRRYKGDSWRESRAPVAPWGVTLLTATPGTDTVIRFRLEGEDRANPILDRRLNAQKRVRLIELSKAKENESAAFQNAPNERDRFADKIRIDELVKQTKDGLTELQGMESGLEHPPAFAIVVNRVAKARAVFERLREDLNKDHYDCVLMIGVSRSAEREALAKRLEPIKVGNPRNLERPMAIVATQCIEASVDIDVDGLISEAAPLDVLRQRFGRLNRAGRPITPHGAIIGSSAKSEAKDPVYGESVLNTWNYLTKSPDRFEGKEKGQPAQIDFGIAAFEDHLKKYPPKSIDKLLAVKPNAPVLLPAHLDLLSQTAPIPKADPDVSLYLHGPARAPDSVTLVWRADIDPAFPESTYQLMQLMPPRAAEAIELPAWAIRQWLSQLRCGSSELADIPVPDPALHRVHEPNPNWQQQNYGKKVFRWTGDLGSSEWIHYSQIRSGDTLILPAIYGGVDEYGWNPDPSFRKVATDVAAEAARPYAGSRFAVRVAPGLLDDPADTAALALAISATRTRSWKTLRNAVKSIGLPQEIVDDLDRLDNARGSGKNNVRCYVDAYDEENHCPRGVVFLAPLGITTSDKREMDGTNATEDDISGSISGSNLNLLHHSQQAEKKSEQFAVHAGLSQERILDLKVAAYLHDVGKADPRFQAWLASGDPLGRDSEQLLAKSARPLPRNPREYSGLPPHWRHEALSVRLAPHIPRFQEARDPELVLWLVGTHHGYGRPFFPHSDVEDARERTNLPDILGIPHNSLEAGAGPQSLAFDWKGLDWPGLYECLKARYGVWELARMETIQRLADHRASEQARVEGTVDGEEGPTQ